MSVQTRLYGVAERKLVLWSIAAMLFMSTSFIVPVYIVVTGWADQPALRSHESHRNLIVMLIAIQVAAVTIGTVLSFVFSKKALRPILRAHQAQSDFVANAHHQLRTPIAIMQAEVDTAILSRKGKRPDYERVLRSLDEELHLLRATGENLLLLAGEPSSGLMPSTSRRTSDDLAQLLPIMRRRYALPVKAAIGQNLSTTVSPGELTVLFEALFDNTIKHAGLASKDITVDVTLRQDKNRVWIVYRDNGRGIAKGEEKRLFERSFQGSYATKDQVRGSGLGLAIIAAIVQAHAGTVAVSAGLATGFQLEIQLPAPKR